MSPTTRTRSRSRRGPRRADQDERALTVYRRVPAERKEAEDLFLEGRSMVRLGQTEPASAAYEAAIGKDANHPETLAGLAGLYMQADRFDAAVRLAERLTRQPEWEARAQVLLGTRVARNNDFAGAAHALSRWTELDPLGRAVEPETAASLRRFRPGCSFARARVRPQGRLSRRSSPTGRIPKPGGY